MVQEVDVLGAPKLMRFLRTVCGLYWDEMGIEILTAVLEFKAVT